MLPLVAAAGAARVVAGTRAAGAAIGARTAATRTGRSIERRPAGLRRSVREERGDSEDPPPRMTWGRAVPVLALCVLFDAIRLMFQQFWFFGPAFAAVITSELASSYLGAWAASGAGAIAGLTAGAFAPALQAFGLIMAMAVGLLGWAAVTLTLVMTNRRIYKTDTWAWVRCAAGLAISEIPFVGTLPMLTVTHWSLFRGQIRKDKEALKAYNAEREQVAAFVYARQEQERALIAAQQAIPEDEMVAA